MRLPAPTRKYMPVSRESQAGSWESNGSAIRSENRSSSGTKRVHSSVMSARGRLSGALPSVVTRTVSPVGSVTQARPRAGGGGCDPGALSVRSV